MENGLFILDNSVGDQRIKEESRRKRERQTDRQVERVEVREKEI